MEIPCINNVILSYLILSYLILSYLLSYLILSYLRRHEQLMMQLVLQKAPSQSLPLTSQQYYPFQEQRPHNPSLLAFTSATQYVSPQHGLYSMPSETDSKGYYSSTSPGGTSDYTQLN